MRVAIVGAVSSQWDRVPWENKTFQIWTVPRISAALPRADRVYELHPPDVAAKSAARVKESGAKVYTWADLPDFDGPIGGTIAAMIAHAVHEGVKQIGLYGSPFSGLSRKGSERESAYYWLGYARASGVKIIDGSGIITKARYCLEEPQSEKEAGGIDG